MSKRAKFGIILMLNFLVWIPVGSLNGYFDNGASSPNGAGYVALVWYSVCAVCGAILATHEKSKP